MNASRPPQQNLPQQKLPVYIVFPVIGIVLGGIIVGGLTAGAVNNLTRDFFLLIVAMWAVFTIAGTVAYYRTAPGA